MEFMPILICYFLLNGQFMISATALGVAHKQDSSNVADSGLIDASENSLSRRKRDPLSITLAIVGILAGAAITGGTVSLTEYYRASASDECAITVVYRQKLGYGALNMNFKAGRENNWNYEKLTEPDSGVDVTKEKVTGGRLTLIQIYPEGKFCIEGITLSCGSQTNSKSTERSVILDVPTIRNAWFRQGNPRFLEVNWERGCIWFSNKDYTSVRAIDVYPNAFTDCENAAEDCIKNHIEVF